LRKCSKPLFYATEFLGRNFIIMKFIIIKFYSVLYLNLVAFMQLYTFIKSYWCILIEQNNGLHCVILTHTHNAFWSYSPPHYLFHQSSLLPLVSFFPNSASTFISVCFLDSTWEKKDMILVFLSLVYFRKHMIISSVIHFAENDMILLFFVAE
jgi:hypothetical protein